MAALHMPEMFKGRATPRRCTCGICQKVYGFRAGKKISAVREALRAMGWTYRDDLGWICPCRHQCEALTPDKRPHLKRPRTRRHRRQASGVRALIQRRNRQEGE